MRRTAIPPSSTIIGNDARMVENHHFPVGSYCCCHGAVALVPRNATARITAATTAIMRPGRGLPFSGGFAGATLGVAALGLSTVALKLNLPNFATFRCCGACGSAPRLANSELLDRKAST